MRLSRYMDISGGIVIFDLQDCFLRHSELSLLICLVQKACSVFSCKKNISTISATVL